MKSIFQVLSALGTIALWLSASSVPAYAQPALTNIAFISNGELFVDGAYINDTIVDSQTSPLAFTLTNGLSQPFLNASDSTISLSYGTYYAIAFRSYGAMVGSGTVSFVLNGKSYVQNVTFPDPTEPSGVFASFVLPGGDLVTVASTGLSADRISIVPDGGGLVPDGVPDAFYLFTYLPPNLSLCDVNQDTFVNVRDVQFLTNQALGGIRGGNDVNQDGVVNVVDIQVETNWVLFGCPAAIKLTVVNPNFGGAGQMNESVVVTGQATHWVQGVTTASFGAGITVASLTINSANSATVVLNIDLAAAVGTRNVSLTTGAEAVTLSNGFSVAGLPVLTLVNPNSGAQSQPNESVNLTGQYTNWVQGATTATFGGGAASSGNLTVQGLADVWLAGQPAGSILGGDSAPVNSPVLGWTGQNPAADSYLTVSATGFTDYGGCPSNSPDGDGCGNYTFGSALGISGFNGPANALVGVFVNASGIAGTPPDALDFTTPGAQGQATISPLLNQVFFIGDGLTGTGNGSVQQFMIPAGATQLYLGSTDTAGTNYNNAGQFTVVVSEFDSVTVTSLTVNSPTSATAVLHIDSAAALGARNVTVTTGAEVVSMSSGFTVTPGPHLLSISPSSALAGQANLPVTITGQLTHFTNASAIDLGPGITASAVSATDATHLSANLTVAGSGNLVQNGSLEDLGGLFVNTQSGYMALSAGATTIAGWTVTPSTTNEIVWALSPTDDSQYAADGKYFVDLTGFGSDSPDGGVTQQLQGLISGQQYTFSMDTMVDTTQPAITIGSVTVVPAPGPSFQVGTDTWAPQTATFIADSTSPVLTIANQDPSQSHCYIDNIAIAAPGAAALGSRNLTVSTGAEVESLINAFAVSGIPVVLSVVPPAGSQTQTNVPLTITGQYTHFGNTSVVTFSGAGVTAGAPTAATATSVTVLVTIAAGAALGSRQIQVQTGSETVNLAGAYTVIAPVPGVTQASPNTGPQGSQNLSVSVTGQFTHWVQGVTMVSFGVGITVATLTVNSAAMATAVLNIDQAAVLGPRNIVFTTGAEAAILNNGFTVTLGTPVLTLISPNTGVQGQLQEIVNVTGNFTNWVQDATGALFGDGVTPTALNVTSPTSATLYVNIDPAAVPGPRTVVLYTANGTATLVNGFTVIASTPVLTLVNPNTGQQGQQSESVNLTGQFTNWVQGATTASFGAGIAVATLTINSATTAAAVLNIDPAAVLGARSVTLTTGSEVVTLANGFTVVIPAPTITSALPGSGLKGQAFQVAITGQNTHFQQGVTKANFGPGVSIGGGIAGSPGLVTVTSSTTATLSVSISAPAAAGSRTILVRTGTEEASLINGFVVKGPPYLSSISPNSGNPGDTLSATIHGTYTSFQQGVTMATFGAGISVGGAASGAAGPVTVTDSGDATAQLTIDPAAAPGLRNPVVQTGTEQVSLTNSGFTVLGAVTGPAPVATIATPMEGDQVTFLTTVTGSVDSPNLSNWILEYQASGSTVFTQFGSGTTTAVSATFDPTMLLNGMAQLRLTATDVSGQTGVAIANVVVAGKAKVGNFSVSFNDLTLPLAGIPIEITRSYNTFNKASGDFGFGWSLSVQSSKVQTNGIVGDNWKGIKQGFGAFASYCVADAGNHVVTLALQGGETYTFTPTFTQPCGEFVGPQTVDMIFTPSGTTPPNASLTVPDGAGLMVFGSFPGDIYLADPDTFETYDPDQFILTLPTGLQVQISKSFGIQNMTDRSNHTLTFTPNGILSSAGPGVAFARDGQNRITTITDPSGNVLTYTYSDGGDLTQVQDALAHVSTFTYDSFHDLVSYVDASGHQPIRNVYDDSGRLIQVIDAFGNVTNLSHDLGASTETIADALGNQTTFVYDSSGNVLSTTDALGHVTMASYDSNNNPLAITDPLGHTSTFSYDANGNRLTQADALGNTQTQNYDTFNNILTTQDPNGNVSANAYDSNGNLLASGDALGNNTARAYDASGNQAAVTDPLGHVSNYTYNGAGKLASSTDPAGVVTTFTYDPNGNRTSKSINRTTPAGPQTLNTYYQYDANNNQVLTTNPDGTTYQKTYNPTGQITSEIDELSRLTLYSYDDGGRLTQVTYPDGKTTATVYDANGRRTQSIARSGAVTTFAYDAVGHQVSSTSPTGAVTQTTYDAAGNKLSDIDPLGNTTQYTYDASNRTTSITDALHHVTKFTYDAAGNKTTIQDANGNTTTQQFDANNRVIKTVYPDGTFVQVAYDQVGKAISRTDAAGNTTQFGYDSRGRLVTVTDALGHTTAYGYDEVGNRVLQTDANGHKTSFAFDDLGRRIGRTLPGGESESFAYDSLGNLASHTDFNGKVTSYTYDFLKRLLSKTPDSSFLAQPVTYTYTADGQRESMTDSSGTSTYTYDSADRLVQAIKPNGTLSYSYDQANNLTSMATGSGTNVTYTYDALNRLSSVADAASGVTQNTYDAVGNLAGTAYPNGVSHTYTYNNKNLLTNLAAAKGTAPVAGYTYTLDPTGRRLSVAELSSRIATYTYDSTYKLTSETVAGSPSGPNGRVAYTWDPAGNRLQTTSTLAGITAGTFTYDADDRLTTDTYDADGNTTSSGGVADAYDFENHLIQHGAVTIVYDGDGNRVSKTTGGVTTKYLVDDNNLTGFAQVIEESGSDGSTRRLVYGMQRISQKQFVPGSSATLTSFYVYDGHGSVRSLTDASGALTDTYDYDAFGNAIHSTGATPNEFLFAGEQFDADLGLYYNRARYLKPSVGRFFTMDTFDGDAKSPISLHKYLYASGDPVSLVDPSGHDDLGTLMVDIAINAVVTEIGGFVLQSKLGSSGTAWLVNEFLPPGLGDEIAYGKIDAGFIGFGGGITAGAKFVGLTYGGGIDIVIGAGTHHGAEYTYYGGGLTLGKTQTSVGFLGYVGALWRTPDEEAYEGYFRNIGLPLNAVPGISAVIKKSYAAVKGIAQAWYVYGPLGALAPIVYQALGQVLSVDPTLTLFWDPTNTNGSVGFSLGVGGSIGGSSSNISLTTTNFDLYYPPGYTRFR